MQSVCAPVIHVNGDDAPAVIRAVDIALAYRQKFGKDVVIDLVRYQHAWCTVFVWQRCDTFLGLISDVMAHTDLSSCTDWLSATWAQRDRQPQVHTARDVLHH